MCCLRVAFFVKFERNALTATEDPVMARRKIWQVLTDGRPVVLTSHVRLDGDGAGSVLALRHALRAHGVDARHIFEQPTPPMFNSMPGMTERCPDPARLPERYHLAVIDCGNWQRIGKVGEALTGRVTTVNIDHHSSNTRFGDLNLVDPTASSVGEMMYDLLREAGAPITQDIAECLFAAIVSDTGQFSHEDTNPNAFTVCGDCVRAGARPDRIVGALFASPSPAQVKLQHLALGTLQFHYGGRIATMDITRAMFDQVKLQPADTEGFAELPISIQGVQASALFKEMPGTDYVKVSMRSRNCGDVCAVAREFGGGGHMHAAGCEIRDTLAEARRAIVQRMELQLEGAPAVESTQQAHD